MGLCIRGKHHIMLTYSLLKPIVSFVGMVEMKHHSSEQGLSIYLQKELIGHIRALQTMAPSHPAPQAEIV